jgi:outer membrane protein TolC
MDMKHRAFLILIGAQVLTHAEPLTLAAAQEQLFAKNIDVASARVEVRRARAELTESWGGFLPTLDAIASYNYFTRKNSIEFTGAQNPFAPGVPFSAEIGLNYSEVYGADVTLPLFTGLSRYHTVKSMKASVASKEAALDATRNRQSFALGLVYLQWLLSYKQIVVRQALVNQLATYAGQVKAKLEAGTVILSQLLDAQARLQLAKVDVVVARDLTDSLRREVMSLIQGEDKSMYPDTGLVSLDTIRLPSAVNSFRSELKGLEYSRSHLAQARASIRGRLLPSIVASAGFRYALPGLELGATSFMSYGVFGAAARWNIFDGLKNREQAARLSLQIALIDLSYKQQLDQFTRSLDIARDQLINAENRFAAARESREAARALAGELKNQVSGGVATAADYLNALIDQAQADLAVEQARIAKRVAALRVLYAAGKEIIF